MTESPGLYFLGLTWQHTRGSTATRLTKQIVTARLGRARKAVSR